MRHRSATLTSLTVGGLLLAGCTSGGGTITNTVIVTYHKVGVCTGFQEDPGSAPQQTQLAGNGLFVVYVVDSIANNASGATAFTFDTSQAYVSGGSALAGQPFSNHFTLSTKSVDPGATATNPGWFALNVDGASTDVQNGADSLSYHSSTGESVLFESSATSTSIINGGICTPSTVP